MNDISALDSLPVKDPTALIEALSGKPGFAHLGMAPDGYLTEGKSQANRDNCRFIITTAFPEFRLELRAGDSPQAFLAIKETIEQHLKDTRTPGSTHGANTPFTGGFIGFAAYELGFFCEPSLLHHAQSLSPDMLLLSTAFFGWALVQDLERAENFLLFHPQCSDTTKQTVRELVNAQPDSFDDATPAERFVLLEPFRALDSKDTYIENFKRVQNYIQAGDCYQANLAQCFEAPFRGAPWHAFRTLSRAFPTPFSAYLDLDEQQIVSLSPERFVRIEGREIETKPIKGTRRRGATEAQDIALREELAASEKDRAENLMIVDLLRNDLGRSCVTGSVRVDSLFRIESYRNVHHLVSTISGRLLDRVTPFAALMQAYPGGSITGAPKIRAMEVIQELESQPRGPYCGSIFYLSCHGRMDSSISIRTALCRNGTIRFWGGGGVVADSEAESEYQETLTKVRPIMEVLEAEASESKSPASGKR
ncbi:aminodeoxychorismate synthase component I [Marinobacter sp. TBZ242]|uniref:Aminodeoxychorismate synthase component I n=1 Tax=Marinobacter azerbaijanicus TaxID=3050455 RepID=A0ABT7I6C8_9GAMM|nr:aminodeoxychorismate synthase component I [Marinobacter sp. TBZ242]MDL0429656.1 aminodeoxychorismate synthase component I [Marinobacter sp. TBZ242]